ncbi:hypothetical protein KR222_001218, partial [Zaprionus bogoriensis]
VSALNGFGLAIGSMDILGALFFELMILYLIHRRSRTQREASRSSSSAEKQLEASDVASEQRLRSSFSPWMLRTYLLLLNVWIVVSILMLIGILWVCLSLGFSSKYILVYARSPQYKPRLLLFWLVWCAGGLLFDAFFLFWWIFEIFTGDAIEAFTNILISLLTMAIEFGFIFVIYNVYVHLSQGSNGQE